MFSKSSLNLIAVSATSVVGIGVGGRVITKKMGLWGTQGTSFVNAQTHADTIVVAQGQDYSDQIIGLFNTSKDVASATKEINTLIQNIPVDQTTSLITGIKEIVDSDDLDKNVFKQSLEKCSTRSNIEPQKTTAQRCLITIQTDQIINKAQKKMGDLWGQIGQWSGLKQQQQ